MKKKIVLLFLSAMLSVSLIACDDILVDPEENTQNQQENKVSDETKQEDEIVVSDLLSCPQFTAEQKTSAMVDQIALTAKEHAANLTDSQASQIISTIKEADHKFYNGPEEMEKFMWYGYLLDYKYDDSDARSQLGTDLCQAIKYVYRGVESVLDDSTHENLLQIDKDLEAIQ